MAELKRVYWDSCCWIGLVNGEAARIRALEYVYEAAKAGSYELWTSTLSYVEVNRLAEEKQLKKPLPQAGLDKIEAMFAQDCVKLIPLDMEIGLSARRIIRQTPGLTKKNDAAHLASALRWSIEVMHTYDNEDLVHLDGKFKCKNGEILKIGEPDDPPDGPLFGR